MVPNVNTGSPPTFWCMDAAFIATSITDAHFQDTFNTLLSQSHLALGNQSAHTLFQQINGNNTKLSASLGQSLIALNDFVMFFHDE